MLQTVLRTGFFLASELRIQASARFVSFIGVAWSYLTYASRPMVAELYSSSDTGASVLYCVVNQAIHWSYVCVIRVESVSEVGGYSSPPDSVFVDV